MASFGRSTYRNCLVNLPACAQHVGLPLIAKVSVSQKPARGLQTAVQAGKGFGAQVTKTKETAKPKAPTSTIRTAKDGRPLVTPHKVSPMRVVPDTVPKPLWHRTGIQPNWTNSSEIHNAEGIARMRAAGKLAAQTLDFAGTLVKPGVTTEEIDEQVHRFVIDHGAYPSPLNYGSFPKSVCTSVNEVICHGIPDSRPLQQGDIVNIDVTVLLNGYHGDTSRMFYAGQVSDEARLLCEVTKLALEEAIKICKPNAPLKQIGATIQGIADKHKMGVVGDFVGHGVGRVFHASPQVLHRRNNGQGVMKLNQTFTIEPMLVAPGGSTRVKMWRDNWTAVTSDGSLSAQFEHTILITETGAEILTKA